MLEKVPTTGLAGKLLWGVCLPVLVVSPAYVLVPFARIASLVWLVVVMLPIAVLGALLGGDRRADNAVASAHYGAGSPNHADNDAKIGSTTPLKQLGAGTGFLALGSFLVVVFVP